jgi:hypothetical protein
MQKNHFFRSFFLKTEKMSNKRLDNLEIISKNRKEEQAPSALLALFAGFGIFKLLLYLKFDRKTKKR